MDKRLFEMHARLCKTFANPKRLEIIHYLRAGEKTVSELQKSINIPKANLSQQLGILREKGLLETRRDGQNIYYRLAHRKLLDACDIIKELLIDQLEKNGALANQARKFKGR